MVSTEVEQDFVKSPFRFPGSKAQAIKFIKDEWERMPHEEFREPFLGGGAVFFAKPKVQYNWLNDIDKDIIITYKIIADPEKRSELIELFKQEKEPNKKRHTEIKEMSPKNDLERAFKTFYLSRTSYSGIINKAAWGYSQEKSVPPERWPQRISIAGQKLENTKITSNDFSEIITASGESDNVFMFIDPPYYKADQKRAYTHSFRPEDHIRLEKELKKTKYKFCLTYDNCQEIKDLYSWADIKEVSWRYHTANSNKATRKMGNELIITNF